MDDSKFIYVTYLRTTQDDLWRALTAPDLTRQYWVETWQESKWEEGAAWRLLTPDGRLCDSGEVLVIERPRRLVLSWRNEFKPEIREEGFSRMAYELEQQDEMVKLTVIHEMDRIGSKFIESIRGAWPLLLASLKSLLETGRALEATRKWPEGL